MPQWRRIAQSTDIAEGGHIVVEIDEEESVLLSRVDGRAVATGNTCPHYGAPLGDGVVRGGKVVCPYHNATFHLADGALDRTPAIDDLPTYEVREEDGSVFLGERSDPRIGMPGGSDDRQVLIVGAGAAGSSCAETLRREGFAGRITMITADSEGPYDRPMLSKGVLSGDTPAKYLPLRPGSFYESLGITLVTDTKIVSVEPDTMTVESARGENLTGDFIVLSTGGVPRRLGIPGADLAGVFTLRTHTDARAIIGACADARSAVVIGASFIGMEVAAQLRQRGLEVVVIEPQPQPMRAALGPEIGAWLRSIHEEEGVTFRLEHEPTAITGDSKVRAVRIDDGSEVDADLVVMGVGVEPRVDYLASSGLIDGDPAAGVRVDSHLETSALGIYAAGDIARYPGGNDEYRVEHWVHAQEQGRHVARAILGDGAPYRRVPFFWSRQFTTSVKYAGFPLRWDRIVYDGTPAEGAFAAGFFAGDRLIGVAAAGRAETFAATCDALESGEQIDEEGFYSGMAPRR